MGEKKNKQNNSEDKKKQEWLDSPASLLAIQAFEEATSCFCGLVAHARGYCFTVEKHLIG